MIALCTGCAPGANDELRALVEEASFPGSSSLDCEWGSSGFESEPKSWYGCWDYVRGTLGAVSASARSRLEAHGFAVSSRTAQRMVQLTATRGADRLCVDVLARGFDRGRNTVASEVNITPGEVFVDIWTTEPRSAQTAASRRCGELPRWPDE